MSRLSLPLLAAAFLALAGSAATASRGAAEHEALITRGVVVGDVTADAAVLWARDRPRNQAGPSTFPAASATAARD